MLSFNSFQISLMVQRIYGSEGKIEVTYRSMEISAIRGSDFVTMETNAIVMEPGVTSGLITIQVCLKSSMYLSGVKDSGRNKFDVRIESVLYSLNIVL